MSLRTLGLGSVLRQSVEAETACHWSDQTLGSLRGGSGVSTLNGCWTQHVIQAASTGRTSLEHPGEHYHLRKADQDVWKRRRRKYPRLSRQRGGQEQGASTQGLTQIGRSLSRARLSQLSLSSPSNRRRRTGPCYQPSRQ